MGLSTTKAFSDVGAPENVAMCLVGCERFMLYFLLLYLRDSVLDSFDYCLC